MRISHLAPLCCFVLIGSVQGRDRLKVPDGGFNRHPSKTSEVTPNASITDNEVPELRSLRMPPDASLSKTVAITEPPKPEHFEPTAWFGLASVDIREVEGERGRVTLSLRVPGERRPFVSTELRVEAEDEPERLYLHVPAEQLAELRGKSVLIEVATKGAATVLIDNLELLRFPGTPSRALLGKANGHLGPDLLASGSLGFTAITEHRHHAFQIHGLVEGGAAARAGMKVGDVVIAIEDEPLPRSSIEPGWDWFRASHEACLGRAIEAALVTRKKTVTLTVRRADKTVRLPLTLRFPEAFDEGFPMEGALADVLREDLVQWTATHQKANGGWSGTNAVNPALGGLALLSTRDTRHGDAIERCVDFLLATNPKPSEMTGLAYWTIAFQGMFFAEYFLATGNARVVPWMEEALAWLPTTTHECKWGMQAFGHGPDGLPYDAKSLIAPAAHLLVFDALARKCGIDAKVWEHIEPYVVHTWSDPSDGKGHGGMGYNASYKDQAEFWSRSGLIALATALRGEHGAMRERLCVLMAERHPWMLNSHAYGEPGGALGLVGLAVAHRESFDEVLPQWRWKFLNAWEPGYGLRYSTAHMGAPYMGEDVIVNLAYTLVTSIPSGGLVMTGGEAERWLR